MIGQIGKSPELLKNLANAVEELAEKYEPEKNKICKSITKSELTILRLLSQDLSSCDRLKRASFFDLDIQKKFPV